MHVEFRLSVDCMRVSLVLPALAKSSQQKRPSYPPIPHGGRRKQSLQALQYQRIGVQNMICQLSSCNLRRKKSCATFLAAVNKFTETQGLSEFCSCDSSAYERLLISSPAWCSCLTRSKSYNYFILKHLIMTQIESTTLKIEIKLY